MQFIVKVQFDPIAISLCLGCSPRIEDLQRTLPLPRIPFSAGTAFREAFDTNIGRAEVRPKARILPPRYLHVSYLRRNETHHEIELIRQLSSATFEAMAIQREILVLGRLGSPLSESLRNWGLEAERSKKAGA